MVVVSDAAQSRGDLVRRVADLERAVRELSAARRNEASAIASGGITIRPGGSLQLQHHDGSGSLLYLGPNTIPSGDVSSVEVRRKNGSLILWAYSTGVDDGFLALYDKQGNIIVSDDGVSGQGLATPYVPGMFASMSVPTDGTAGTSFTGVQKAIWRKQHPRIRLWTLWNVTSTTAEIRWKIVSGPNAGTVIGGPNTVGNGFSWGGQGPFDLPGAHLSEFEIDVEVRVASGTGRIDVRTLHAIGIQSP